MILYHQEALYQIFSITLKDDISFKMTYNANDYTLSSFYAPFGRPVPGPVCHYCAAKHSGAVFWEPLLCFGSQYKGKTAPRSLHCLGHILGFPCAAICSEGPKNLVDANNNQESALSVKIVRGSFGQPEHVRGYGFIYFLQHTITANRGALERERGGGLVYQASIIESLPAELPPPHAI